jgi:hypothetical protein
LQSGFGMSALIIRIMEKSVMRIIFLV